MLTRVGSFLHHGDHGRSNTNKKTLHLLQSVERLTGYKLNVRGIVLVILLTASSGGTFWFIVHKFPKTVTWLMSKSSLQDARFVLAKVLCHEFGSYCAFYFSSLPYWKPLSVCNSSSTSAM